MIVRKRVESDKGEPNWRIRVSSNSKEITIHIENFQYGFLSGEEYEKIFIHRNCSTDKLSYLVSFMTKKGYETIMENYNRVIETYFKNAESVREEIEDIYRMQTRTYNNNIKASNAIKESTLFREMSRDNNISKILE